MTKISTVKKFIPENSKNLLHKRKKNILIIFTVVLLYYIIYVLRTQ
jgi:hypothetical protein